MCISFKRLFLFLSFIFLASCASKNNVELSVSPQTQNQVIVEENLSSDEVILDDNVIQEEDLEDTVEPISKEEKFYSYQPKYEGTLLFKELEKRVKKVEVKKIVVKPVVDMDNSPISLSMDEVQELVDNASLNIDLEDGVIYDDKNLMALIDNYKNILKVSYSCCVSTISQKFKDNNLPNQLLVNFLSIDADEYGLQNMCLIVDDVDVYQVYDNPNLSSIVIDSKNDCICNNADYLKKNIDNFYKIYNIASDFYNDVLIFRFKDKKGRIVEQDINESVLNIANALDKCV